MTSTIGTTSWIAAELFLKRPYSEKADVYSFGVLVWEVLFGGIPFETVAAFDIPQMVVKGARPEVPG
jgi:serine/threonine protein kinase